MHHYPWSSYAPEAPDKGEWDAIVIGTGMGGGFAGLGLAERGQRVLFVERGGVIAEPPSPRGWLARRLDPERRKTALRWRSRWPEGAVLRLDGRKQAIMPALGNGPGGSSAIYGTAVERFVRADFTGEAGAAGRFGELPNRWPVAYDEMLGFYRRAEAILRPSGSNDACDPDDDARLRPPPRLSDRDTWLLDAWHAGGLKPYRVHAATDDLPGCTQCLGEVCPRRCKGESASRGLMPALEAHGASLLLGFTAERLETVGGRVRGVVGRLGDREMILRGRMVILAAGALATPLILHRSTSETHPHGIGNAHDMVGRGAMFHNNQTFAVWAPGRLDKAGPAKTFSSRAFYVHSGERLGSIQSFTAQVQGGHIADYLIGMLPRVPFGPAQAVMHLACKLAGRVLARAFRDAVLFSTATEDYAYAGNRVVADPASASGYAIEYDFPAELLDRSRTMRKATRQALRAAGMRVFFLSGLRSLNLSHVAGTCRMGDDPTTSVVDRNLRVWGMENLYIADSSVLPTASAMNPSLTVAACALRLAEHLGGGGGR